jgi:hypothetical protein
MWRNWYLRCRDIASIKRWLILWPFTVYYGKSGVRLRKKRIPGSFFMVWYRRAVAAIPLHDAIEEYVAIRKRKRVTDKKVTEIVNEQGRTF